MQFDVIVVGAGSAGAPVAALLAAQSSRRVLLLEAGDDYRSAETPEAIKGPNFAMALALGRYHWLDLQVTLTDRQAPVQYLSGLGVGGTSAINAQGAVRGMPDDFDRWARNGCYGWAWRDVLPTFCRVEHDSEFGDRPYHGTGGPIPISRSEEGTWGSVSRALREAAAEMGHPWHEDINAPDSTGVSPAAWNRARGARISTNDAYLEPARSRSNLTIKARTRVERLLFSGSRVTGVQAREDSATDQVTFEASEVILCAGAIHSPAILLRSGIGPADDLRKCGLRVVVDLPGVGRNLQDHPMIWLTFPLVAAATAASPDILPASCVLRFSLEQEGQSNTIEVMPLDRGPMDVTHGGFLVSLMRPRSQGSVRLASAEPNVGPIVEFCMLSEADDVSRLRRALRHVGSLACSRPLKGIMGAAFCLPSGQTVDEIDDDALGLWLKSTCMPNFHAAGTCRMGAPADPGAVVNADGRVLGVEGLRVVDTSIMPDLPAAPPHLTTVMLAEHLCGRRA
jgi:5-(hydroxymethyl)furfural/furfural oxidase